MLKSQEQRLVRLLEKLAAECMQSAIIVEGKKDAAALSAVGVDSGFLEKTIIILNRKNSRKSLYETAELIAMEHKKTLLMFDADRKGLQLSRLFKGYLQQNGVRANTALGKTILKVAGKT